MGAVQDVINFAQILRVTYIIAVNKIVKLNKLFLQVLVFEHSEWPLLFKSPKPENKCL